MKKLNVFETFAGIGSQHKALEFLKQKYGFDYEIVATSEWDAYANIAYHLIHTNNFCLPDINIQHAWQFLNQFTHSLDGQTPTSMKMIEKQGEKFVKLLYSSFKEHNNLGSILEVTGEKLLKVTNNKKINLITYSFPCQDLSVAGSFHGFNQGMEEGSGTRSSLLWQIGAILSELRQKEKLPEFLLLENVKNMISSRHKNQYIKWLNHLKELGYITETYVLNAKDYGIPQNRVRVYAISYLDSNAANISYENFKTIDFIKLDINIPKKEMFDILKIDYSNQIFFNEAFESCPNNSPSRQRMFNDNHHLFTKEICKNENLYTKHNNYFYRKYCSTITKKQDRHPNAGIVLISSNINEIFTKKYQKLKNNCVVKKSNYRFITPREAYMLMGFDENDYEKVKEQSFQSKEKFYQQAGNSIVVNTMIAIMYKIQKKFNNQNGDKND